MPRQATSFQVVWFGALIGALSCSQASTTPPVPVLPAKAQPPEPRQEALWLSPSHRGARPRTLARLADGDSVSFDDFGVRSRIDSAGKEVGAPLGVPERLLAVHAVDQGFIGVAASGSIYVAREALAPWALKSTPSEPFMSVALGASDAKPLLLGIRENGSLHLSADLGQSWELWPSPYFFYRAYANQSGQFLLQSLPEAWFVFRAGSGLEPVTGTLGGAAQVRAGGRGMILEGAHASWLWSGRTTLEPFKSEETHAEPTLSRPALRFATAGDLGPLGALDSVSGRVFILEPRGPSNWQALVGGLGAPLSAFGIELAQSCVPKRTAIFNQTLILACSLSKRSLEPKLSLYASLDGGQKFRVLASPLVSDDSAIRIAAGPAGRFALHGICPPSEAERGCEAHGLWTASVPGTPSAPELVQIPFPEGGAPLDFQFASDGAVFALYQREVDNHIWLYRAPLGTGAAHGAPEGALPRGLDLTRHFRLAAVPAVRARLFGAEQPLMGLSLEMGERHMVMALDQDLQIWGFGDVPGQVSEVGISGRNVLGLVPEGGKYWQSYDAGLSFRSRSLPAPVQAEKGKPSIACSEHGCLLGQDLILSGWGDPSREAQPTDSRPSQASPGLVGIECRYRPSPSEVLKGVTSLPTAHDSARGDVAWSQVAIDAKRAQVSVLHARYGQDHIERHELLPPSLEPERAALFVSEQIEGSVALRYRLPSAPGASIDQIEVAWDNRIERILRREFVTLAELGPEARAAQFSLRAGDFEYSPRGSAEAKPWLLSVSGRVTYLGLHARFDARDGVIVLGDKSGGRFLNVPESLRPPLMQRMPVEVVSIGGQDAFLVLEEGSRLLRFPNPAGSLSDMRLAPAEGQSHLLSSATIAYRGSVPHFSAMIADERGAFLKAYQVSVEDAVNGKAASSVQVPVFADLAATPRACSAEERGTGPRTIAVSFPEEARSVKVEVSPRVWREFSLLRAVVQGTLESPCVSMLEAEGPTGSARTRVLVDLEAGAVSWHFQEPRSGDPGTLAHAMDCAFGPALAKSQD